jgi:hypothetical protein
MLRKLRAALNPAVAAAFTLGCTVKSRYLRNQDLAEVRPSLPVGQFRHEHESSHDHALSCLIAAVLPADSTESPMISEARSVTDRLTAIWMPATNIRAPLKNNAATMGK